MKPLEVKLPWFYPVKNAKEHRTDEFELVKSIDDPTPIFRRGQHFTFTVKFNRNFDPEKDVVRIRFEFGPKPSVERGTRAILPLLVDQKHLSKDHTRWGLLLNDYKSNSVTMTVQISTEAPVGIWKCLIQTNISGETERIDYPCKEDIYILFNPWHKNDLVYMENEEDLEEYILNETGQVWKADVRNGMTWIYGQFDEIALPAAVFLLEKSKIPHADRGSPILVSRALSAVININDEDGLIFGAWLDKYEDGVAPWLWTGSVAILEQYLKSGEPVKYGQCWVFGAVTVTICRALGIPCRVVTNYSSAHDTNKSLTIDTYFNSHGKVVENGHPGSEDSCWNFHVWNDVWMARPDLPAGYGGWQVIDATPQETSDGSYCCGPASVEAVKRGEVGYVYDTAFVFSEVNADCFYFQEDENSLEGFKLLSINKVRVGQRIVTKKPGKNNFDMWDVTPFYKNPEGSKLERISVLNAIKGISTTKDLYQLPEEKDQDVEFQLVNIDFIPLGNTFDVIIDIRNKSNEERTIAAVITAISMYYNGVKAHEIKKKEKTVTLKPGEKRKVKLHVTPEEYLSKLVEYFIVKVFGWATVLETRQVWVQEDDRIITKPSLLVRVKDKSPKVGEACSVAISFRNPLDVPLTKCIVTLEGRGLQRPKVVPFRDIDAREIVTIEETFVPRSPGEKVLVVNFSSSELQGLVGKADVTVLP